MEEPKRRRCVREVEPFDDEFMIVAGDPAYVELCSSLAARIQEITLKAQAEDAADETSQEEQASTESVSGSRISADYRCICMEQPASGCPCASGAVISNSWLDKWPSCARPPSDEAGEGFASRTLLFVSTAPKLRKLAEQGVEAIQEIKIAAALAKSIKKAQVPLPLLFYTTDTHQFAGLFEVHPDGIAIQSEREATAVVYRRLQLVPLSIASVRSALPKLAKHVSSQLKSSGPSCIILDGVQKVNRLFEMMLQETAQRRQLQCAKLLEESTLGPFCVLSGLERARTAARKDASGRATPPPIAISSADVLRLMAGKRTLFVGDLLARQLYRYLVALLQGKEAEHDPNNAEFGEMSFSDDILLHRTQASVWSADYVEEREMRSSPPAASTNSMMMMRSAAPSHISVVRLYYISALAADNVEEVVNHVAGVADKLRIDNIYVCFGAMQTIVQAAPTATFLRQLSEAFHQFVSGLAEQLQCPMTCLLNPPSSCGEMPESCPTSQAARAAIDLQLQLFNDVVQSLRKQYAYEVADLWTVGAELLADQLDDGAQYHTDAIRRFLFEICRPLLGESSGKVVSKIAQPEVALFPGKGLSQRHLEVPIEDEVVWLHRSNAVLAYKFEGDDRELYSVTPFDESSSFRSSESVRPQEVLLKLDPLSALESAPPPLPQVEETAPMPPSTSVSAAIAMEPQDQPEDQDEQADLEQTEASPQQPEEAEETETTEAPQPAEKTAEEQADDNKEEVGNGKKLRRSARKRRDSNTPTTGKRRRQQRTVDDLEVAMAYEKQASVRENDEDGD